MSDTIGIIGQKYEDRKSKKIGILLDRDEANKKLNFLDTNAEPFQVSYAAFKSNWRKVIEAPVEPVDETADEPTENVVEEEPTAEIKPAVLNTEDEKIRNFVDTLTDCRVASVDIVGDTCQVMADNITICVLDKVENGYEAFMLPDIFIFTEWGDTIKSGDVHFNVKPGRHSGVLIDCVRASLGDILQLIKTAAVEINLYGYID